jgi:hypothetical protein
VQAVGPESGLGGLQLRHLGGALSRRAEAARRYHITTHRSGKRVTGKLSVNYSLLGTDGFGDYMMYECLPTARFSLSGR